MSFIAQLKKSLENLVFPAKIKVQASAGMVYHSLATSNEPFSRFLHQEIKSQLDHLGLELVENLATLTIEINVRRKPNTNTTAGKIGTNQQ